MIYNIVLHFWKQWASGVVQKKAPVAKADGLGSVSGIHMGEGENRLSKAVLRTHPQHTQNKYTDI